MKAYVPLLLCAHLAAEIAAGSLMSIVSVPDNLPFSQGSQTITYDASPIERQFMDGGAVTAKAKARTEYGALHASVFSNIGWEVIGRESTVISVFEDYLNVDLPKPGQLIVHVETEGTVIYNPANDGYDSVWMYLQWGLSGVSVAGSADCTRVQSQENLEPRGSCNLIMDLPARLSRVYFLGQIHLSSIGRAGEATLDFYNTSRVAGLGVRDLSGMEISGATISSDSGTVYPALGAEQTAVPEPRTWALVVTGLCLVGARKRLRRS